MLGIGLFEDHRIALNSFMRTAKECFDKSAALAQRARLASGHDKQFILYGMAWMWMTLSKHAELRETVFEFPPPARQ